MNKFKKATKRIVAVAASAALISSSAFANLGSYPNNFVKGGKFVGKVVVGEVANSADTVAAQSIIDNLKTKFSSSTPQVEIQYKKASSASGGVSAINPSSQLNYGETLGSVVKSSSTLKNNDNLPMLQDGTFRNGVGDQTFKQKLTLKNGQFNHQVHSTASRPGSSDRQTHISDNIYYPAQTEYATYEFKLDAPVKFSYPAVKSEFVGKTLKIMGNDYTIISGTVDSSGAFSKLVLLGGANTVSLKGGDTVNVNGHRISVGAVDSNQVQVIVDGQSKTIDKYSTDVVSGVDIGVLSLFPMTNNYPGSANLVIGGKKIEITSGNVRLNGQNLNVVNRDYSATASFISPTSGFKGFTISYKTNKDTVLEAGDSLVDPIFGGFSVVYDGTNTPTYKDLTVTTNGNSVHVSGTTVSGEAFDHDLLTSTGLTAANSEVYVQGANVGDRVFTNVSSVKVNTGLTDIKAAKIRIGTGTNDLNVTAKKKGASGNNINLVINSASTTVANTAVTVSGTTITVTPGTSAASNVDIATAINNYPQASALVTATGGSGATLVTTPTTGTLLTGGADATKGTFNLTNTAVLGDGFLLQRDANEQYFYEINNVDTSTSAPADHKVSFDDLVFNSPLTDIVASGWKTDLGLPVSSITYTAPVESVPFTALGNQIAFENNLLLNFEGNSETNSLADPGNTGDYVSLTFSLDKNDINADNQSDKNNLVTLKFSRDTINNEFDVKADTRTPSSTTKITGTSMYEGSSFVNLGNIADVNANDYKVKEYVTSYGIKVTTEDKDYTRAVISVPDQQLQAKVRLVPGVSGSSADVQTKIVDKANLDKEKQALIDAGNVIVGTKDMPTSQVTFDITAPVLDKDVNGNSDLIVVGGPAVNKVAADLLGLQFPTYGSASGVNEGEGIIRYFKNQNSVLVYGYEAAQTTAAVKRLNEGNLSGDTVNVQQ